jgi:peptidoglycan/xylan/chitin deacetylase (PgdA/CDA1 family)
VTVKSLARRLLSSGPWYAAACRRADEPASVLLLTYHTIGPDGEDFDAWTVVRRSDFVRQVDVLRRRFDIVSIDEALQPARSERPRVVLTFDDGHTGWHDELLPIVLREGLPVTLYTATSHIEDGNPYWFDRVMNAVQVSRPVALDLQGFRLGLRRFGESTGESNWLATSSLLEAMKALDDDHRERAASVIERAMAAHPHRVITPLRPLSIDQLREIAVSPLVTIAAHSHDHRLLDRLPLDVARASLDRCRRKLQAWTGREVHHVAFPNGNFSSGLCAAVAELGFASAATTKAGRHRPGDDPFALPRVFVGRYDDLPRFKLSLVGS